jgi:hypothetical protein
MTLAYVNVEDLFICAEKRRMVGGTLEGASVVRGVVALRKGRQRHRRGESERTRTGVHHPRLVGHAFTKLGLQVHFFERHQVSRTQTGTVASTCTRRVMCGRRSYVLPNGKGVLL